MCPPRNGWGWEGGKWRQSGNLPSVEVISTALWGGGGEGMRGKGNP